MNNTLQLSYKNLTIGLTIIILISVAAGRYSVATKKTEEKQSVIVKTEVTNKNENTKVDLDRSKRVETTTVEERKPDGTTTKTTKTITDTDTKKITDKQTDSAVVLNQAESHTSKKTEERTGSKTTISALAGINVMDPAKGFIPGALIQKDVLFFTLGFFAFTDSRVGGSLGLSF